jgi:hypothetical protein
MIKVLNIHKMMILNSQIIVLMTKIMNINPKIDGYKSNYIGI